MDNFADKLVVMSSKDIIRVMLEAITNPHYSMKDYDSEGGLIHEKLFFGEKTHIQANIPMNMMYIIAGVEFNEDNVWGVHRHAEALGCDSKLVESFTLGIECLRKGSPHYYNMHARAGNFAQINPVEAQKSMLMRITQNHCETVLEGYYDLMNSL